MQTRYRIASRILEWFGSTLSYCVVVCDSLCTRGVGGHCRTQHQILGIGQTGQWLCGCCDCAAGTVVNCCAHCGSQVGNKARPITSIKFAYVVAHARVIEIVDLLLTYSTTFVVGPDIYSRLFCAQNEQIARKSVLISAIVLIPFSLCITFLGVFAAYKFPEVKQSYGSTLIPVMLNTLPEWGIGLLVAALLSAVMSTGSTTLLTSATIISDPVSKGLGERHSMRNTKIIMLIIGILSIILSLNVHSIIQSLLIALTIFSGAFIVPTLAGLYGFTTSRINSSSAMITGGVVALSGKIIALNGANKTGNLIIICAFILNALLLLAGNTGPFLKRGKKFNWYRRISRPC